MPRMSNRPAFQRRHYVAVAALLADARKAAGADLFAQTFVNDLAVAFTDLFRRDNGRFRPDRFDRATRT